MDDKAELVAFARESAKSGLDLYDLLGVDGSTSRDDIHRAWRRKGLKYHPDKAGDNYDPTLYERFMRARDVLVDDDARKVYDTGRAAEAQRKMASEQMSSERRRFQDELEAAEKAHATSMNITPFGAPSTTSAPESTEHDKLREAGRRRAEERTRREQEAQDRVRQREDDRILEIERRLREKVEKALRRADKEKKKSDEPAVAAPAPAPAPPPPAAATSKKPPPKNVEAEWKRLVQKGSAKIESGGKPTVDRKTQLFTETMARLTAAGRAQRQRQKDAAAGAKVPTAAPAAAPTPAAPASEASAEAPAEVSEEAPEEALVEAPADEPAHEPAEAPEEAPEEAPAEALAEAPAEAPADEPADEPPADEPLDGSPAAPNPKSAELRTTVEPVCDMEDASPVVELFEPQWEAVDDPEVSQFIKRVPKFSSASSTISGDVEMETVG